MNPKVETISVYFPLEKIKEIFPNTLHENITLVNKHNQIAGVITKNNLNSALKN
ncbi:MAG TPA: hypothetical protein GXX38_04075 [Clostridia bacterium]|nr:hypothetical protein [Clostridia bacterium]